MNVFITCAVGPIKPDATHRTCFIRSAHEGQCVARLPIESVNEIGSFDADGIMDTAMLKSMKANWGLSSVTLAAIGVVEVELVSVNRDDDTAMVKLPGCEEPTMLALADVFDVDVKTVLGSSRKMTDVG